MTEQDERTIYEWVYEELKGKPWATDAERDNYGGYHVSDAGTGEPMELYILNPLDMNFAFDVCMPKLLGEKLEVTFLPGRHRQYVCIETTTESERCKVRCNSYAETMREAFYTALLAYIKGMK